MPLIKNALNHLLETGNIRLKALFAHLIFSLIILGILLILIVFYWYPQPYFTGDGGWRGIKLVASVDLVLGPLITLLVFNPNKPKKELKQDISIILMIQLIALSIGTYIVWDERTRLVMFSTGTFYSLDKLEIKETFNKEQWRKLNHGWPPLAVTVMPKDDSKRSEALKRSLGGALPIYKLYPELVKTLTPELMQTLHDKALKNEAMMTALESDNVDAAYQQLLKDFLKKNELTLETAAFFPIIFRDALPGLLVLDKSSGTLLNGPEIPLPALGLRISDKNY